MVFIETHTLVTRFNLTQILGNQIVDWAVVDANFQLLGNTAAHLTAGNAFSGAQTFAGNVGMTGAASHRRFTVPTPATNETDRVHFQAEAVSANGTFVGVAGPVGAGAGQRKSTFVLHGVEPTGTTTPAGLTFLLDEDNHRSSIQALGTYQDLVVPTLQLGAGGTDRFVIPSAGAISVTGAMTLTGALTATGGSFTTLSASAGASFASTSTFTGLATFNGGISSAATLTINAPLNVTGLATFSGGIAGSVSTLSGGNTIITGTLSVTGATTLQSTLSVTGAATFGGAVRFAAGASYIQALAADNTQVQVSGGLSVGGTVTAGGSVSAGSQIYTTPGGSLYLRGADGNVHIDSGAASLTVAGSVSIAGTLTVGSTVHTTGAFTSSSGGNNLADLTCGATNFTSGVTVTGGVLNVSAAGNSAINGNLVVGGLMNVNTGLTVAGGFVVSSGGFGVTGASSIGGSLTLVGGDFFTNQGIRFTSGMNVTVPAGNLVAVGGSPALDMLITVNGSVFRWKLYQ